MTTQSISNVNVVNPTTEFNTVQNNKIKQDTAVEVELNRKDSKVLKDDEELLVAEKDVKKISITEQARFNSIEQASSEKEEIELLDAIETIAEFMNLSTRSVNFKLDDSTDKTIIKIFDVQSNDLIKQFPSEEVIAIAKKIVEFRHDIGLKTGILLDEKV